MDVDRRRDRRRDAGVLVLDASRHRNANANANANADANANAGREGGTARIDAAQREELRRKIFEGMWKAAEPESVPPAGGYATPPPKSGEMNPEYVQARLKEDFRPMAKACYQEMLARVPDAGGRLLVRFTIVGDEKVGGIVESAELDPAGTLSDPKLDTCIRESMMSMSFAPPEKGGSTTIVAPIVFLPGPK
jgi:hypothetical protein